MALSQGNLLDQEDIDLVEVGMTRGQVRFLIGTQMIAKGLDLSLVTLVGVISSDVALGRLVESPAGTRA